MEQATAVGYPLVDTHAHLTWDSFADMPEVLARVRDAGIERVLTVATDMVSSESALRLAHAYPEVFASVGIHPNGVHEDDDIPGLLNLTDDPRVVAIGETGLDYYRHHTAPALQRRAFTAHLELAARCKLPIIIHNRDADQDILRAIDQFAGRVRGVLHCFGGDEAMASAALDLGYYISFAGNLTYPSAAGLRDVAAWAPVDRLLVETDAPFLAPIPRRGKRNEPAYVRHTFAALATCRGADPAVLARQVTENARALFGW